MALRFSKSGRKRERCGKKRGKWSVLHGKRFGQIGFTRPISKGVYDKLIIELLDGGTYFFELRPIADGGFRSIDRIRPYAKLHDYGYGNAFLKTQ